MAKIGFDPHPRSGVIRYEHAADVRSPHLQCTLEPIVTTTTGVEAIFEGLRLANVEGFKARSADDLSRPADDVDAR